VLVVHDGPSIFCFKPWHNPEPLDERLRFCYYDRQRYRNSTRPIDGLAAPSRHQPAGGAPFQAAGQPAPGDLNTVKLLSSGSEATETAFKLCRQFWKQAGGPTKWKVISRNHGAMLGAMAASGVAKWRQPSEPLPVGFIHVPTMHCYRCPYGREHAGCDVTKESGS
jgi:hypothetical protein